MNTEYEVCTKYLVYLKIITFIVLIFNIIILIFDVYITYNYYHEKAIENNCAIYNQSTGEFEWIKKQ